MCCFRCSNNRGKLPLEAWTAMKKCGCRLEMFPFSDPLGLPRHALGPPVAAVQCSRTYMSTVNAHLSRRSTYVGMGRKELQIVDLSGSRLDFK